MGEVIWHLHEMRRAADAAEERQFSAYASLLIRELEELCGALFEKGDH